MNNLVKAAIGVTSTGTACTGGYFICREYIFSSGNNTSATNKIWKSLSGSTTQYSDETLGKIYGEYLLDPFDQDNQKKWEENYKKVVEDESTESEPPKPKVITDVEFQESVIKHAFSEESDTSITHSLNKECKKHYEKQMEAENETDNSKIQIGSDKWKAIWLLCSEWNPIMLGKNPTNYPDNSVGKIKGKELLSTQNSDNEELWKKKNKKFFELSSEPTEKTFKELYTDNKDKENSSKLKEGCESAYKLVLVPEQDNQPKAEDVIKYCSLKSF